MPDLRDAIISFPMFGEKFSINPPYSLNSLLEQLGKEPVGFDIYFYGVIIAIGFLLAVVYASKVHKRFDITMDDIYDYVIWAVISAVIFARLYYCVTYTDLSGVHTYLQDPASILRIRDGGLAIYGGVIGAVLAILIRAKTRKISPWPAFDIMAFGLLIGQMVGRWGNFFNREAFGYETDIFCRMGLTVGFLTVYVHPAFLYESLWNLLGFLLMHFHSKKHRKYQGQYLFAYLIWYGVGRALIESLRSDSLWLIPNVIRVSQLLAVITAALSLGVWIVNAKRLAAGKKPLLGKALDGHDIMDTEEVPTPAEEDETVPAAQADGTEEASADTPEADAAVTSEPEKETNTTGGN